jgi:hypothetical protein
MDGLMVTASGKAGRYWLTKMKIQCFCTRDEEGQWAGCVTIFREPSYQLIERFELFEWEMYKRRLIQFSMRSERITAFCYPYHPTRA